MCLSISAGGHGTPTIWVPMDSLCKVRLNFGWGVRIPAWGGLQRPSKAGRGQIFFLAQMIPFDPSVNP